MRSNEEILNIIIQARKKIGMSVNELAETSGIAKSSLSRYENGKRILPLDVIETLCKILSLSPAFVLGFTNNQHEVPGTNQNGFSDSYDYFEDINSKNAKPIILADLLTGSYAGDKSVFVSKATNDSMNKIFPHGSLLMIKRVRSRLELNDTDIVVAELDKSIVINRYFYDSKGKTTILIPDSNDPRLKPQSFNNDDKLKIIGKVIAYVVKTK